MSSIPRDRAQTDAALSTNERRLPVRNPVPGDDLDRYTLGQLVEMARLILEEIRRRRAIRETLKGSDGHGKIRIQNVP